MEENKAAAMTTTLERLGYAPRLPNPHDPRRPPVQLTGARRSALARSERAQGAIEDEVLQALEPGERKTLRELLSRALRSMEPLAEEAVAEQPPYSATTASIST